LRQLVAAYEVKIRDASAPDHEGDGICLPIPMEGDSKAILQARFEPGCEPQEEELTVLKAAAFLAGVILQFEGTARPLRLRSAATGFESGW
jgi:hypothetical protein